MTKQHRTGRYKVKRGKSFAPIPKICFLKWARREACSWHGTERGPQFLCANWCPKNGKRKHNKTHTHAQTCTCKITLSSLNSSEYTCLNFPIVFSSAGSRICRFTDMLIKATLARGPVCTIFTSTETGFYLHRCWEIILLPLRMFICASGNQRWRGIVSTVNTTSVWGISAF